MEYSKGDKFIIEISDVMTGEDGKTVYRIGPFNSLVFDANGLKKLKKYDEPAESPGKACFNRVPIYDEYYHIHSTGEVSIDTDQNVKWDKSLYNVGNYCTDKDLMEQRALHEILNRLLWRYSETHGEVDPVWEAVGFNKPMHCHYYIYRDMETGKYTVEWDDVEKMNGVVYFATVKIAEKAIEDVIRPFEKEHPEFRW